MDESAQNPYIPQESEQIRQKVYEHQSPLGRVVKWSLIITVIVAVLVGVGLFFIVPRTEAVDQPARQKLADTLQPPDQVLKQVAVTSTLGFKLNYDNHIYSSYAEVGGATSATTNSTVLSGTEYENNDLRVTRAYSYVRIRPAESVDGSRTLSPIPPELQISAAVTGDELTKAAAVPENKDLSKLSLLVKLDGDKRRAAKVADDNTVVTIDASKAVATSINGIDYQKVRYTTTNDNYRVSNVKYDDCYYTIQYDQPYSICISNVRPANVSAASLVENVFDSITYDQPQTNPASAGTDPTTGKKTSSILPLARLAQATTTQPDTSDSEDQSALVTVTPEYYGDAASLKSIAKTQPSVVRIGMIYCADLALKFESGDTGTTLTDACIGSLSSGAFISKDGYIATTGHAIRTTKQDAINGYINSASDQNGMLSRLQRVLDYLLKAKIILQSDADYLKTGASTGDQEALAKIENIASVIPDKFIVPVKEEYTYAVQPTDKPIVVNRNDANKPSFAYSDSVISAKYVGSDYDASKSVQEVFGSAMPSTDVGLLKVSGDFPDVAIAANEDVKGDATLNTIGYTAYTDSSLTIDELRNMPIATTSKVDQVYKDGDTRLIQTNISVLPGNDGAPVVDANGQLIGLAVYGLEYCPNDQLCFANGTVRSSSELLKLINSKNISLSTGSSATQQWNSAIDEFFRANYTASANAFGDAAGSYPYNRWADSLKKLAISKQGSDKDTTLMNQLQTVSIGLLVFLSFVTVVLAVVFVLQRRRLAAMQLGHYGVAPTPTIVPQLPAQPIAAPPLAQLPPVQPQQQAPYNDPGQQQVQQNPVPQSYVQPPVTPAPGQATPQGQPGQRPAGPEDPFYK